MELTLLTSNKSIDAYEEEAKKLPQVVIQPTEILHGGMYAREVTLPKGTALTGALYKKDHLEVMVSGDVTIVDEFGEITNYTGYNLIKSNSGKKRAGVVNEDTVWITFNVGTSQEDITVQTREELTQYQAEESVKDYVHMCEYLGVDADLIREQSQITIDVLTEGMDCVTIKDSPIEGKGTYTDVDLFEGSVVGFSRISGMRTLLGRYTNHSVFPNCIMAMHDSDIYLLTTSDIHEGSELTVDYRQVIDARLEEEEVCLG